MGQNISVSALGPGPAGHLIEKLNFLTTDRQTDKQTNSLTPYTRVCGFFLSVKFVTSLLASLAGG